MVYLRIFGMLALCCIRLNHCELHGPDLGVAVKVNIYKVNLFGRTVCFGVVECELKSEL